MAADSSVKQVMQTLADPNDPDFAYIVETNVEN